MNMDPSMATTLPSNKDASFACSPNVAPLNCWGLRSAKFTETPMMSTQPKGHKAWAFIYTVVGNFRPRTLHSAGAMHIWAKQHMLKEQMLLCKACNLATCSLRLNGHSRRSIAPNRKPKPQQALIFTMVVVAAGLFMEQQDEDVL